MPNFTEVVRMQVDRVRYHHAKAFTNCRRNLLLRDVRIATRRIKRIFCKFSKFKFNWYNLEQCNHLSSTKRRLIRFPKHCNLIDPRIWMGKSDRKTWKSKACDHSYRLQSPYIKFAPLFWTMEASFACSQQFIKAELARNMRSIWRIWHWECNH